MKKINLLVWSKNRACQLHLLLESINKYTPDIFNINIVYKYTDDKFEAGYKKLVDNFQYNMIRESDLREDTLSVICDKSFDHIAFSTDDTVLYRQMPCSFEELYPELPQHTSEVFSFRLGLNTVLQDPHKFTYQPPLNRYINGKNTIHWNSNRYNRMHNYGYPLAMGLHVFRQDLSTRIISNEAWKNSNQLESALFKHGTSICYMSSFTHSIAVNIPINNLSGVTKENDINDINDIDNKNNSPEELNRQYLNGYVLDLKHISDIDFNGCHANIRTQMRKL